MPADLQNSVAYMLLQDNTVGGVSSGTDITAAAKTVRLEEGPTDRSIKAAWLEVYCICSPPAMTQAVAGITIDAHTEATVTKGTTGDLAVNTGEDYSHRFLFDFTTEFQTNFDGNSHSITPRLNFTGPTVSHASAKLWITFDYDSANTTQTKTIQILIGYDANHWQTPVPSAGSWTIPNLDTYIPDHLGTPTYNDVFLEIFSANYSDGDDQVIAINIDSGGATDIGFVEGSSKMYTHWRHLYDWNETTNATHTVVFTETGAGGNGFERLWAVLTITYRWDPSATTHIKTVEQFVGQEGQGLSDTSEITLSNDAYIPESTLTKKSIWFEIYGAHEKLSNVCTVKGQNEATGVGFTTDNALKDNIAGLAYDITSLITLATGNNTLTAKLTNDTAISFNGRYAISFMTYTYAGNSAEKIHRVKYPIAQDDNDDSLTIEQALTITLPNGGYPRGGFLQHWAHNANIAATVESADQVLSIDGVQQISSYTSDKEGLLYAHIQNLLDVITFDNLGNSHTYKNVGAHLSQTDSLELTLIFAGPIGSISGISKDNSGTPLASCEVRLFKVTGAAPKDWVQVGKTTSDGTGNWSLDIFESANYAAGYHKDGTPNVFDVTDDVLTAS